MSLSWNAKKLHEMARSEEQEGSGRAPALCMATVFLYVNSLEAFVELAGWYLFHPEFLKSFFQREENYTMEDKWMAFPFFLHTNTPARPFNQDDYPWSHLQELGKIARSLVLYEPRTYFYAVETNGRRSEPMTVETIPDGWDIRESDLIFPLTRIPRNPELLRSTHLDVIRKVVEDCLEALDRASGHSILCAPWCDAMTYFGTIDTWTGLTRDRERERAQQAREQEPENGTEES